MAVKFYGHCEHCYAISNGLSGRLLRSCGLAMTIALFFASFSAHAYTWQVIDQGFAYTNFEGVHAFQIDPKLFTFSVVTAKDFGTPDTTAALLAKKSKSIFVVNGGFFSPEHKSLGLLVRNGQTINPLHPTSWWAVFQIIDGKPGIIPQRHFHQDKDIEVALQVGPRLVVQGQVQKLKPSVDQRSGIGIQKNGDIVIAVTGNTEISMTDFADLFRKSQEENGLDCIDALNLDGGNSTQLYFKWKGSEVNLPGLSRIANGIAVFPRH